MAPFSERVKPGDGPRGSRPRGSRLVSVIIPALNEAENIERTLAAARRDYAPDAVELIVADGGSTDGTPDLVPPDVALVRVPRGRAVQMNRGAEAAHGEIFVFCHADSQLPAGWREAVIAALADPEVSGGTFQTRILPANWLLKLRNRLVLPTTWRGMFGDQVHFMRRATFERVGGYPEIPLMEDVEMMRALHQVGRLTRIDPGLRVTTSSRRFLERGVLRQTLHNGLNMLRYLYLGASPRAIARGYRSSREAAAGKEEG
jgi:rSAM/selenodomain-associated transferase 2